MASSNFECLAVNLGQPNKSNARVGILAESWKNVYIKYKCCVPAAAAPCALCPCMCINKRVMVKTGSWLFKTGAQFIKAFLWAAVLRECWEWVWNQSQEKARRSGLVLRALRSPHLFGLRAVAFYRPPISRLKSPVKQAAWLISSISN